MLSVSEAAKVACVSEALIRAWLKQGLSHFRLGAKGKRGKIAIQREDLDSWLAAFKVTAKKPEPVKAPAVRPSVLKHLKLT